VVNPLKEIHRTFRRFMEIEVDHIRKIESVIYNLGGKPSLMVEGGDIIGGMFGPLNGRKSLGKKQAENCRCVITYLGYFSAVRVNIRYESFYRRNSFVRNSQVV